MKTIVKLFCLSMIMFTACSDDPCKDVNCGSNGVCIEGTCDCDTGFSGANCETNICDTTDCTNGECNPITGECTCNEGYEGPDCSTEVRAKYIGSYTGSFASCLEGLGLPIMLPADLLNMDAVIVADPADINNIILTAPNPLINLGEINIEAGSSFLLPTNTQTIDIPNIPLPVSITVSGQGEFVDEDTIKLSITIVTLLGASDCEILMTKG